MTMARQYKRLQDRFSSTALLFCFGNTYFKTLEHDIPVCILDEIFIVHAHTRVATFLEIIFFKIIEAC